MTKNGFITAFGVFEREWLRGEAAKVAGGRPLS
jgi:hypothetical protein